MKKLLVVLATLGCGVLLQAAPAQGSCESAAPTVKVGWSGTVKLVPEYDDFGDDDWGDDGWGGDDDWGGDWGAFYIATQLTKGHDYTVWIENASSSYIDVEAYSYDFGTTADFDDYDVQDGKTLLWLREEYWSASDPSTWKFFVHLSGDVGDTATVHIEEGIRSFKAKGTMDNPEEITLTETEKTASGKKITEEGVYCYKAKLQEGRKYCIRTEGGMTASPFTLRVVSDYSYDTEEDPDFARVKNNQALLVYPHETGNYEFVVSGTAGKAFDFVYQAIPIRTPDKHPFTELTSGQTVKFKPGRAQADAAYYDNVIDERLFRVKAAKGERWVFDATGADRAVEMRLYDAKGNLLATNETVGDDTHNVRIGIDVTTAGYYYIGVCDPALKVTDSVVCAETTFWARKVEPVEGDVVALSPVPGTSESDPVAEGSVAGSYELTAACWTRTFVIGGRQGISYRFSTKPVGKTVDLMLKAEVVKVVGTKETAVELEGADVISDERVVGFTADSNATYYLRISNYDVVALDYPPFDVYSVAFVPGEAGLGILQVDILGPADATWTLDKETVKYPGGASLLLYGSHTVKFAKATGFNTPADVTTTVEPGTTPTVVTGAYSDTADPVDDYVSGSGMVGGKKVTYKATAWSLKNKESGYDRTLQVGDVADNFTFDGADGNLYDFALTDLIGDAVFSITNATPYGDNKGVFAADVTAVSQLILPKAKTKYVLTVKHGKTPEVGGSYRIVGKFANVGAIKFKSTAVKAKEDAASVTVTLNRTAKDGRVRVKYATVADTATPGQDYVAQSGIIEWADGDNKAKDIVIKLIPDLVATYEGTDHQFQVKIEPIPEDEREADEYAAAFTVDSKTGVTLDTATVTLTETAKKNAGTIGVACATPKKPEFTVRADSDLTLTLTRQDGAVGDVAVTLGAAGIGCADQSIEWKDGESEAKWVTFHIPAAADMKASKKGTIKLTATSKDKPKFTASSVTVNILNEKFDQTVADWAKALPKNGGVAAKESPSGTWFVVGDEPTTLKHIGAASSLTFTLTGPCVFRYTVNGEPTEVDLMDKIGKTATAVIKAKANEDVTVTYEYLYNGGDFETILQGVKYGYEAEIADGTAQGLKVAAGKLPDGIKLEQDKTTKAWYVRGVPTKDGYYYAEIQDKGKQPVGEPLAFCVKAMGTAVGTFNGLLLEDGSALTNGFPSVGSVQFTATAAGKLSAKVSIAGTSYSFSGTGFDEVDDVTADRRNLTATLELAKKIGATTYTNTLTVAVVDGGASDLELMGAFGGSVELAMAVPDADNKGAQEDIAYRSDLLRDNTKNAEYLAFFAPYVGYYTAALQILDPEEGKPQGNGYVTLTLDDKGKCKVAGKLADGTAISSSQIPALVGDVTWFESQEVIVPIFMAKKPSVFGGLLRIRLAYSEEEGTVAVVDSTATLRWACDDAALTYSGEEGWNYELSPVGGWYDTVKNLQRYFLTSEFAFDAGHSDELPEELLKSGYSFVSETMPTGMKMELAGDTLVVDKQVLVKDSVTKLYDFDQSVNPSGLTVAFKRATGVVSGKFDVWTESTDSKGKVTQAKLSGFKHEGVLLLARDEAAALDANIWTAGYYLTPAVTSAESKKKYTGSFQFNILAEDQGEPDWWEQDKGWNPEWGEKPQE